MGFRARVGSVWVLGFLSILGSLTSFTPAYAMDATLVAQLQKLYPDLTGTEYNQKISAATTPFLFLRSFIPFYYELVANQPELTAPLASLRGYSGCGAGDPHIENFGAVILQNGNSQFSINDLDDSGPCPLYADAARFFTSILVSHYGQPGVTLAPFYAAYVAGLENQARALSPTTQALLTASRQGGATPDASVWKVFQDHSLPSDDPAASVVTGDEFNAIQTDLTQIFGSLQPTLMAAYQTYKDGGGSSGLLRVETLVSFNGSSTLIEFKHEVTPGIFPVVVGPMPATAARIHQTLLFEQGPDYNQFYQVANLGGYDMLVRPKWKGFVNIASAQFNAQELAQLELDEAFVLGQLPPKRHRRRTSARSRPSRSTLGVTPRALWRRKSCKRSRPCRDLRAPPTSGRGFSLRPCLGA